MARQALVDEEDDDDEPPVDLPVWPCPLCRGRGRMEIVIDRRRPQHVIARPCILCRGHGYVRRRLTTAPRSSNTVRS
jgi:hypothetical protein